MVSEAAERRKNKAHGASRGRTRKLPRSGERASLLPLHHFRGRFRH